RQLMAFLVLWLEEASTDPEREIVCRLLRQLTIVLVLWLEEESADPERASALRPLTIALELVLDKVSIKVVDKQAFQQLIFALKQLERHMTDIHGAVIGTVAAGGSGIYFPRPAEAGEQRPTFQGPTGRENSSSAITPYLHARFEGFAVHQQLPIN